MEVEFIAQALQLMHVRTHPEVPSPTTRVALRRLADAGLLDRPDAELLIRADRLWRTIQGMLRITLGRVAGAELPGPSAEALTRAAGVVDVAELRATMSKVGREVRAAFERLVGRPEPALLEGM
jgi:glutamate-ammonia-ligase adenylyltransferase